MSNLTTYSAAPQTVELVSLPREIQLSLKSKTNDQGDLTSVEIKKGFELSEELRKKAIQNLEEWFKPLPLAARVDLLSEMRFKTTSKRMTQEDLIIQIKVYAKDLEEFPASVVAHVLKTQPTIERWWPDWEPLTARINVYCRKNKMALDALRNYQKPDALPAPKKEKDLKRVDELMKEFHANRVDINDL